VSSRERIYTARAGKGELRKPMQAIQIGNTCSLSEKWTCVIHGTVMWARNDCKPYVSNRLWQCVSQMTQPVSSEAQIRQLYWQVVEKDPRYRQAGLLSR